MLDLLEMQKYFIRRHLRAGDTAVDFTMGNGNDTLFLSQTVGVCGRVFAFDIQADALNAARRRLEGAGAPANYTLIHSSHHLAEAYVHEPIKAGMFNLGYLPGSGRKQLTTLCDTTLPAVQAALRLLAPDGILMVAVYPGHEEGAREGQMLTEYFATLDRRRICVSCLRIVNSPTSPFFFVVETK